AELSKRPGVEASARTTVELSDFSADANPFQPLTLRVNGVLVTDTLGPNQTKYAKDYPAEVPDPLTPDFVADRINANFDFQRMGLVAQSDGSKVTIVALNGQDVNLEISGDIGGGFPVGNGQDITLRDPGDAPYVPLSPLEGYTLSAGGPYNFEFDVPGQGSFRINLNENYATGADMLNG